jgi:two-component system chemotaxis sensor kinase CheA
MPEVPVERVRWSRGTRRARVACADGPGASAVGDNVAEPPDVGLDADQIELLRRVFMAEAEEGLAIMESSLLRLEQKRDDSEALALVFRTAHSLKGNSASFDLGGVRDVAHTLEDVLGDIRAGKLAASSDLITLLLSGVDTLRRLLSEGGKTLDQAADDVRQRLASIREGKGRAASEDAAPDAAVDLSDTGPAAVSSVPLARSLRVSVERLDQLLSLTGEIAISRARLTQMMETPDLPHRRLQEAHREAERLYVDLQDLVMKLRMVPVGPVFEQFNRTVRDLAHALGKHARLEVAGADVEVDNAVLQLLKDPITHMVRNALDHGIELPDERERRGKPRTGRITLGARRDMGSIVIQLSDDGAGINRERLLARARALGIVPDEGGISDSQLMDLLFEAGFSTADRVSDVSGRGVGLDVVRRNIHALRGTVSIASQPGMGTRVTIRLPLTLAIIEGLVVSVGDTTYVIAVENVLESMALPEEATRSRADGGMVGLRGQPLPYIRLRHVFGVSGPRPEREVLVVVEGTDREFGVVVDAVTGQGQIVIKPLAKVFHDVRGISAATVLGNGQVALILDVEALSGVSDAGGEGSTTSVPAA